MLNRVLKWLLVGCACLSGAAAFASDDEPAFQLQGFGTLGQARTTTKDVEFVRDLSQPGGIDNHWSGKIDSVLGLQATWRISPKWEAVVQGTSRYNHAGNYLPELSWAFAKYDPLPNLSLRAGRLGTEFFMMADSRWVGYSFLTVRPPGDYFWYLPFYSIHGADAAMTVPMGDSLLRTKVFYGLSNGEIPLADEQWNIDGSPMMGGYVEYQTGPWQLRASYANIRFNRDLPLTPVMQTMGVAITPSQRSFLSTRGTRTHYYSVGVVFDQGPWQGQLMLNHIDQGTNALENSDGGYLLAGYRVGEVTPYLGYSWVRSQGLTNSITDPVIRYVMQDSHSDQKTTFVGFRWDFMRNAAIKGQWDAIRGEANSLFPYRRDNRAAWDGRTDVFSLTLDFVF